MAIANGYFGIVQIGNCYTLLYTVAKNPSSSNRRFVKPFVNYSKGKTPSLVDDVDLICPQSFLSQIIPQSDKVNSKTISQVEIDIEDVTPQSYSFVEEKLTPVISDLNEGKLGTNDLEKRVNSSLKKDSLKYSYLQIAPIYK